MCVCLHYYVQLKLKIKRCLKIGYCYLFVIDGSNLPIISIGVKFQLSNFIVYCMGQKGYLWSVKFCENRENQRGGGC